jgi:hypothetical protein
MMSSHLSLQVTVPMGLSLADNDERRAGVWYVGVKARRSTAQHSAAQRSTAQHSAARRSTAQHSTAQCSTAQHGTAQCSTAQHGTGFHLPNLDWQALPDEASDFTLEISLVSPPPLVAPHMYSIDASQTRL